MFHHFKHKKRKLYSPALPLLLLLLSLPLWTLGCGKKDAPEATPPDFSGHLDGSHLTETEISAYCDYILDTLMISENKGNLTGTHNGLFSTFASVTLYDCTDRELLKECFSLLAEYETILSRTMPGSELYCVNKNTSGRATLSKELTDILGLGLSYHETSLHRFDITVAPLSDLWAFGNASHAVPKESDIASALSRVQGTKVTLNGNTLTYPSGTEFDLGAVAKGWISDRLAEYLKTQGIRSAMINLGGNILALGEKKGGESYQIGITMPFSAGPEIAGIVTVKNTSVVTSGIYERCFTENNVLYHHLLDATTGYPAKNDLLSVTIVCENSALADLLSTVCFLLGKEQGLSLIEELAKTTEVYALFLTGNYNTTTNQVTDLGYHFSEGFEAATGFRYE